MTGEYDFRAALGVFSQKNNVLKLCVNEDKYDIPDFAECQFIMNFFIAKRQVLLTNQWDQDLKTEEHHEFFYRATQKGVRTSFSKLLFAKHTYEKPNNSTAYNAHRFEKERWRRFLFLSLERCNALTRVIETKKWDRIVIWEVDREKKTSKERVVPIGESSRETN